MYYNNTHEERIHKDATELKISLNLYDRKNVRVCCVEYMKRNCIFLDHFVDLFIFVGFVGIVWMMCFCWRSNILCFGSSCYIVNTHHHASIHAQTHTQRDTHNKYIVYIIKYYEQFQFKYPLSNPIKVKCSYQVLI